MTTTESPTTKTCRKCGKEYPATREFFDVKKSPASDKVWFSGQCKPCRRIAHRDMKAAKPEKYKASDRAWKAANRARVRKTNSAWVARKAANDPEWHAKLNAYKLQNKKEAERRAREEWIEKHGSVPLCACGCGEEVRFDRTSGPRKYLLGHTGNSEEWRAATLAGIQRYHEKDRVPIDKIRALLRSYKEKNNLTWEQVGERAGVSPFHLNSLMFDQRSTHIKGRRKKWVADLIDRLAGKALTPSRYQTRMIREKEATTFGGLYGLMVVKNEAGRYLQACLEWNLQFLDDIFILDDGSDDETLELCLNYTDNVIRRPETVPSFMEHESRARQYGWQACVSMFELTDRDWILAIDADEFLVTNSKTGDIRESIDNVRKRLILEDRWCAKIHRPEVFERRGNGLMVRTDKYWPRDYQVRLARYRSVSESGPGGRTMDFTSKQMGGGSLPAWYLNARSDGRLGETGPELELLHVGYMAKEDREEKYTRYTSHENHGHSNLHIDSILTTPRLEKWQGQLPKIWRGLA